jgi:uncharacterized protein
MNDMTESPLTAMKKFAAMSSALISRMSWLARAGLTHADARDLWTVFGYSRTLTPQDLFIKYKRQDVAKTIVEAPADAVWTRPPVIHADQAFVDGWNGLVRDFQIWSVLNRVDYCLGFGRFGIIVIGLNDGKKLDQPATGTNHKVTYLQPYSEMSVDVQEYQVNPADARFGRPLYYNIKLNESTSSEQIRGVSALPSINFRVHWTRVIHIADNIIEDPVFGTPRLEPVYNLLQDLLKCAGGGAETFWLTANRGLQIDIDKDMETSPESEAAMQAEVDEYYHNLRRFMRTRGVKMTELSSKVADPSSNIRTIMSLIAACTRIPQRLLMGAEAGQLASEQDRANWAERVDERRTKFAVPAALLPTMARFTALGILPEPGELSFEWPEAFILGPLERAQTSAQKARSAANLSKVLTDQPKFLTVDEARNIVGLGDSTMVLDNTPLPPAGIPQ